MEYHGKPKERRETRPKKIPTQSFPNQWRIRPTIIHNQWRLRRTSSQIQWENHGLSFKNGWEIRSNTLQNQWEFCKKLSKAIGNHVATCQLQSVIHPKSVPNQLLANPNAVKIIRESYDKHLQPFRRLR